MFITAHPPDPRHIASTNSRSSTTFVAAGSSATTNNQPHSVSRTILAATTRTIMRTHRGQPPQTTHIDTLPMSLQYEANRNISKTMSFEQSYSKMERLTDFCDDGDSIAIQPTTASKNFKNEPVVYETEPFPTTTTSNPDGDNSFTKQNSQPSEPVAASQHAEPEIQSSTKTPTRYPVYPSLFTDGRPGVNTRHRVRARRRRSSSTTHTTDNEHRHNSNALLTNLGRSKTPDSTITKHEIADPAPLLSAAKPKDTGNDAPLAFDLDNKSLPLNLLRYFNASARLPLSNNVSDAMYELQRRVEEQNALICMLHERADREMLRCRALTREQDEQRSRLEESDRMRTLYEERAQMLDKRFEDLAHNHEEMIRIKDWHKDRLANLQRQLQTLQQQNDSLITPRVRELEDELEALRTQHVSDVRALKSRAEADNEERQALAAKARHWQAECEYAQKELNASHERSERNAEIMHDMRKQLQQKTLALDAAERQIKKQNDELLQSQTRVKCLEGLHSKHMQQMLERGRLLAERDIALEQCRCDLNDRDELLRQMNAEHDEKLARLDENRNVIALRRRLRGTEFQYEELQREFEQFKRIAQAQLENERSMRNDIKFVYKIDGDRGRGHAGEVVAQAILLNNDSPAPNSAASSFSSTTKASTDSDAVQPSVTFAQRIKKSAIEEKSQCTTKGISNPKLSNKSLDYSSGDFS